MSNAEMVVRNQSLLKTNSDTAENAPSRSELRGIRWLAISDLDAKLRAIKPGEV